jgi:integrase
MPRPTRTTPRGKKSPSFRVGRVRAFLRGRVWYLCYHEQGRRHQPRVGPDREAARQLAAEINAQLEVGAPTALGFESIAIPDLRQRWLDHHEYVRRSSLETIRRYRAATEHLLNFVADVRPLRRVSDFRPIHAEEFVRHLRSLQVAPNGHRNSARRRLRDKGIKYILETCSTLFNYAARQRHLPPYAENPFRTIEINRIPIEDAKPIVVFTAEQEQHFLEACDDWQFPIFATLLMTGLRPGELTHLLLPDNLDLDSGWLYVRNKPGLGWKVKTRNERDIPLMPSLVAVLRRLLGDRRAGPVFQQRRCLEDHVPPLAGYTQVHLEREVARRAHQSGSGDRQDLEAAAKTVWRDIGALKEDWIRKEFMALTRKTEMPEITAPKTLRHTFATCMQDANVDPLIRNELMGHSPGGGPTGGVGLGMTAVYTHTRPETKRKQLEDALAARPANLLAAERSSRSPR